MRQSIGLKFNFFNQCNSVEFDFFENVIKQSEQSFKWMVISMYRISHLVCIKKRFDIIRLQSFRSVMIIGVSDNKQVHVLKISFLSVHEQL